MTTRPAWAEIQSSAITANIRIISGLVGSATLVCAVVKADAYGHGALIAARAALAGGASRLAVALASEGRELRNAGITTPILVLGAPRAEEAADIVEAALEATVFEAATIRAFDLAARTLATKPPAGQLKARLHLKIDTGMNRVGCAPDEAPGLASLISSLAGTELAGVYSHFADADALDPSFAQEQLQRFFAATSAIEASGLRIPLRHIANSAGALWIPESRFDMVRIGIAMYGLKPDATRPFPVAGIEPALAVKAKVVRISTIEEGETVSYGRSWKAHRRTRVATIPMGYADGYPRIVSSASWAGFQGHRLPQIGRVCMDLCMFDATELPGLEVGDTLCVMGRGGPSLDELAFRAGTINYEIACHAGLRLPRVEMKDPS